MPQLIIKWGNRETRFNVTTPNIDIGRADDNLLQIKNLKVSRYQCQIVQTTLGFLLIDLKSGNGTFLNGKRVKRTLLRNNDVLKIGNVDIVFSESDSVQAGNKGPVVISSGQLSADASVGEVTTIINIQEEKANLAGNGGKPSQNGTAQGTAVPPRPETAVVAQVAKLVTPNPASAGPSVQRVINNQVLQNGSSKPSGTPEPASSQNNRPAQPARLVASQSQPNGIPKPAPASRFTPASAPKSQVGLISGLNKSLKSPASSVRRISSAGVMAVKAGEQAVHAGKQVDVDLEPEQPKKNKNMLYLIGGAVLILIVIIAFLASSGSNKKADSDSQREAEFLKKAEKLYEEKDYKEALKKYEAFLEEFNNSKNADDVKDRIKKIKELDEKEKESRPKLVELKRKKKEYPTSKYPELLKEFDGFIKEYSDVSPTIIQEAKGERDTVKRIVSSSGENEVNVLFNKALGEANALRDKNDYDGAIAKLKSFLKDNRSLNDRQENAIKNEIKAIEKEKREKSEKK